DKQKQRAETEHRRAEWLVYQNQLALAHREWQQGHVPRARRILDATRREFRGWEYDCLYNLAHNPRQTLLGHTGSLTSVCFSPDGKHIVSGSLDQTVKVWDAATGQEILSLRGHTGAVTSVCFSPDGKRILSGGGEFEKPGE